VFIFVHVEGRLGWWCGGREEVGGPGVWSTLLRTHASRHWCRIVEPVQGVHGGWEGWEWGCACCSRLNPSMKVCFAVSAGAGGCRYAAAAPFGCRGLRQRAVLFHGRARQGRVPLLFNEPGWGLHDKAVLG
jgi:hypothetical protein